MGRHRHGEDDDTVAILDGASVDVPLHTPAPRVPGWLRVTREDLPLVDDPARRKRRLAALFAAAAAGLAVLIALTSVLNSPTGRGPDRAGVPGPGDVAAGTPGAPVPVPATESPEPSASDTPDGGAVSTATPSGRPSPTRATTRPPRPTTAAATTTSTSVSIAQTTAGVPTTAPADLLAVGARRSLRLATTSDRFLARRDSSYANLVEVGRRTSTSTRDDATVTVLAGRADDDCFSFRLSGGRYLRHRDYRLRFDHDDGSQLFRLDATFCARPQSGGTVAFESVNYPGYFIHVRDDGRMWIDRHPRASEAVFRVTAPLA